MPKNRVGALERTPSKTHIFSVNMNNNRPNSAVSTFGINPSLDSVQMSSPDNNTPGQFATTIPVGGGPAQKPPRAPKGSTSDVDDEVPVFSLNTVPSEYDESQPSNEIHHLPTPIEPNRNIRHSGDAREGVMELTNLVTNPVAVPGELPSIGLRRDESSEALNLTLHQCARDGDEYNMKILIRNLGNHVRKKINQYDEDDLTPLHYAARYNHLSVVKLLVESGADVQATGEDDVTPLHHAARYRREKSKKKDTPTEGPEDDPGPPVIEEEEPENEEVIANNTEENKPVSLVDGIGESDTELITQLGANGLASLVDNYEQEKEDSIVNYLVSKGANINTVDIYGQTPLHFAAMRGNEVACRDLLYFRDRVKIGYEDKQGITPLHSAAIHNHLEIARMLLEAGADLMCRDKELSTPLHHAASEGNMDLVQVLFEAGARTKEAWVTLSEMVSATDIESSTALHVAVDNGHYEVAKVLLEKRAEVNKPRKHFMYPLHLAAQSGDIRIARLLVENHARIDAVNSDQATALHRASALNHVEVVKFLVDRGARINRPDKDNYTPLLLAATYGNVDTVELLLQKGADYRAVDKYDKTAIFMAAEENKMVVLEKLLSYQQVKRLVNDCDCYDNSPLHVASENGFLEITQCLLDSGADLDDKNEEEQTPLHLAAKYGRTNIVRELIKRDKTIVNDEDENSNTALHLAAQYGHNKVAKVLLDLGADVSARNYNQWTPLDLAASKGWTKTCTVLLEEDAPVDPTDKNKTTPLHLAAGFGHSSVVELLLDWDADVTLQDDEGRNCLDRAIEDHRINVAMAIVNSSVWKDALRNATRDPTTGYVDTPMRKLIKRMPDVAERVFDRCLSYGQEKNPERIDYEISFDYEFLDDIYARWIQEGIKRQEDSSSDYASSSGSSYGGDDDEILSPDAQPYSKDSNVLKKNHPLYIMILSEREDLLAHPLVTSLLQHKWNTFGSFFYYLSFFIYCIFLTFITAYMVTSVPPHVFGADASLIEDNTCGSALANPRTQPLIASIGTYVIMALSGFMLLKELLQIYQAKLNYFGWTNLIEWIVYVTALLLVISFNDCQRETGYRYVWQWHLGAISVFLAWMDLVLFIQKFPQFGIYVVMFTDILRTFSQFFIVFFLFIIAFALAFYSLFQNQVPFDSVGKSIVKTSVMMIGEFEFDSIFNEASVAVNYAAASYIIFIIFLIIMSILIMNLLVGLAVDDIKAVQEQAALKRMAMQVELALDVERIIPDFIRRKAFTRRSTIRPNRLFSNPVRRLLSNSYLSPQALQKALNPELDEIEKVQEGQEKLDTEVKKLKKVMKDVKEQNQKLESMLRAIVRAQGVSWEEEDYQEDDDMELPADDDGVL
ncbi:transient receptor potential cation channel subfamily A member 1 homolog [Aplysia californica]|uniref:Transient receptor potential cation channel subfamily A member 1 homolog n=1 Tax=Aplysia californica TaxID=6500 RepID=A0ABM1VV37_APLCA|nr:transient receptor potential cation channel subfamily A member 1 homolog [Aplysia californica]